MPNFKRELSPYILFVLAIHFLFFTLTQAHITKFDKKKLVVQLKVEQQKAIIRKLANKSLMEEKESENQNEVISSEVKDASYEIKQLTELSITYPLASRMLKESGKTTVKLLLSQKGEVKEVTLIESSGHKRLDDEAMKAAMRLRYTPTPIEITKEISFHFQLEKVLLTQET